MSILPSIQTLAPGLDSAGRRKTMDLGTLRLWRALIVCMALPCALAACETRTPPAAIGAGDADEPHDRAKLTRAPLTELTFAPADAEAIVRVDLAAIARGDAKTQEMLDFLLRAQQPKAWQYLQDCGVRVGQELRAVYLVVGPRAKLGPATLIAGVGDIDVERAAEVFAKAGGTRENAPGGGIIIVWVHDEGPAVGATVHHSETKDGPGNVVALEMSAVGIADGLIMLGPPQLVRRALAVRAGEGKDVRAGALADELTVIDPGAEVWGVARAAEHGVVDQLAPGLARGRFHARLEQVGRGEFNLRAEFGSEALAKSFQAQLKTLIGAAAMMTRKSGVGASLVRLRDLPIHVEGKVVRLAGAL
jgi:hypothetical protein